MPFCSEKFKLTTCDMYLNQAEEVVAQPLERLQLSDSITSLSAILAELNEPPTIETPKKLTTYLIIVHHLKSILDCTEIANAHKCGRNRHAHVSWPYSPVSLRTIDDNGIPRTQCTVICPSCREKWNLSSCIGWDVVGLQSISPAIPDLVELLVAAVKVALIRL
jgi:hypothetical protein